MEASMTGIRIRIPKYPNQSLVIDEIKEFLAKHIIKMLRDNG